MRDIRSNKFLSFSVEGFGVVFVQLFLSSCSFPSMLLDCLSELSVDTLFETNAEDELPLVVWKTPYKTKAYSRIAAKTSAMHITKKTSTAFRKPLDVGASLLTLINMLMRTKNKVTSNPILPGMALGGMIKEIHETITNNVAVRYT